MKTIAEKLRAIMRSTGKKQMDLAEYFKVSQSTVNRWLAGAEPEGPRRDAINDAYEQLTDTQPRERSGMTVPLQGYIGAGSEIEPDFEQTPPEGLDQIWIPFELDEQLVAFEVRGISMLPVYREGHVIICYRDQKRPLEHFFGLDAAVRISDGRRFIKTVMRNGDSVDLHSFNADPIQDVQIEWIGEIFAALPKTSVRRLSRQGGVQGRLQI